MSNFNITTSGPTFRFVDGVSRPGPSSSALSHQDRTTNHHPGLVKQAYSAWVMVKPSTRPQKWHLTAYFTYTELPHLPTIDRDPNLRKMIVPPSIYSSSKTRSRSDDDVVGDSNEANPCGARMLALPSISTLQNAHLSRHSTQLTHARLPEDERIIHMLNSGFY